MCVCLQRRLWRVCWSPWHVRPWRPLSTWRGSRHWPNSLPRSSTSLCALMSSRSAGNTEGLISVTHTQSQSASQYHTQYTCVGAVYLKVIFSRFLLDENSRHPEWLQLLQKNYQSKPDKQHEREFRSTLAGNKVTNPHVYIWLTTVWGNNLKMLQLIEMD